MRQIITSHNNGIYVLLQWDVRPTAMERTSCRSRT